MTRIILFFVLLISARSLSQNLRIGYEYKFVEDSLHPGNITREFVYLDITENGSNFYSRPRYLNDSLSFYKKTRISVYPSKINFSVKKYPSGDILVNSTIGNNSFTFRESEELKWNISPEKKQISGLTAQKATLSFGGRNWTAWFSDKIPVQDGPYIFHGLPGLVLSIEDEKKQHTFNMIGIEKKSIPFEIEKTESKILTRKEFNAQWKMYKVDPNARLKALSAKTKTKFAIEWNGEMLNQNEIYKREEERAKKEILHKNNFLDLNLYK